MVGNLKFIPIAGSYLKQMVHLFLRQAFLIMKLEHRPVNYFDTRFEKVLACFFLYLSLSRANIVDSIQGLAYARQVL